MRHSYKTKGTCSQRILFDIEDNKIMNVQFIGGCNGNLKGISSLVEGMDIDEVISMRPIQYVGIEAQLFLCRAIIEGKQWLFELKYTIRTHSWCLFRRVY